MNHHGIFYSTPINNQTTVIGCDDSKTDYIIPFTINNITVIGIEDEAFLNHPLNSITIPNINIGTKAFLNCSFLHTVLIENGPNKVFIGASAFSNCSSLSSIILPNSIVRIDGMAFSSCFNLIDVNIEDGPNKCHFGVGVFKNCGIQNIKIPKLVRFGYSAFKGCSLIDVTIEGDNSLYVTVFTLPFQTLFYNDKYSLSKSYENIATGVPFTPDIKLLDNISDFTYTVNTDETTATITGYTGNPDVVIPTDIDSYPVVAIGDNAFANSTITSVTIPNSVITIGNGAFNYCTLLETITIPDSVITIGNDAFIGCRITSITIPNSVTTIGNSVFNGCTLLETINIPNLVTSIGSGTFASCTSLIAITIPNSVTSIGNGAFIVCTSLNNVIIPNSVITIGDDAFNSCTSLDTITIPDSVTTIGNGALSTTNLNSFIFPRLDTINDNMFLNCSNLTSITIPDSVITIGNSSFQGCTLLETITIPNSVITIGNDAFASCTSLIAITIPNSVTTIGNSTFSSCTLLNNVIIPISVITIGNDAFNSCTSLYTITIPNSVTTIGNGALSNTNLNSFIFPRLDTINDNMFMNCSNLTSVTIPDSIITIGNGSFQGCTLLETITIPDSVTTIHTNAFNHPKKLTHLKYVCIQGDNQLISNAFNFTFTTLFYNNSHEPDTYDATLIPFIKEPTTVFNNKITVSTVFPNNITLITCYYDNTSTSNDFSESTDLPLDGLEQNTIYNIQLNFTYENLNILQINVDPFTLPSPPQQVLSNLQISDGTTTINTNNTATWTTDTLQIVEANLQTDLYPLNTAVFIQKFDPIIFTSYSSLYSTITQIYGIFAPANSILDLSKLFIGQTILFILPTTNNPITILNGPTLTSDGTNTFINTILFYLGTSIMAGNYKITMVANASSGIIVEYIPSSNICFPAGTPILTDQGNIPIEYIHSKIHTIHNKSILKVTKTISSDSYLVCIEKDAFEKNVPCQRTIMSKNHRIYYKGYNLQAKEYIGKFDSIYKVRYIGEPLYNVLMKKHSIMKVNNMRCETLNPIRVPKKILNLYLN
jgi:hypothetical protein